MGRRRKLTGSHTTHTYLTGVRASSDAQILLVDLSDTTNYPHGSADNIVIDAMDLYVDPDAGFSGDAWIGFLSGVNQTSSDINIIASVPLRNNIVSVDREMDFYPYSIVCKTGRFLGHKRENYTAFNSTTAVTKPDSTTESCGDGDLVMILAPESGTTDISLTLLYHNEG